MGEKCIWAVSRLYSCCIISMFFECFIEWFFIFFSLQGCYFKSLLLLIFFCCWCDFFWLLQMNSAEKEKSIALNICTWAGCDRGFTRNFTIGKVLCEKLHIVWHFVKGKKHYYHISMCTGKVLNNTIYAYVFLCHNILLYIVLWCFALFLFLLFFKLWENMLVFNNLAKYMHFVVRFDESTWKKDKNKKNSNEFPFFGNLQHCFRFITTARYYIFLTHLLLFLCLPQI